jgi:predicted dienelactone hydrolase
MRVFETLFFFSLVPTLLLPLVSDTWRHRWLIASALILTLAGGLHLVLEGWRIQMVPLYILAVLMLAYRLHILVGRTGLVYGRREILVSSVMALFLTLSGILAGWLLPVVVLPRPTGPYQVGIMDREIVDEARGRRLMASIWYPAAQNGIPAPLTHHADAVAAGLGKLAGLPGLPFQHLRYFRLAASEDVPLLTDGAPFPILIFSHGLVGLRLQNSSTLQELASWGYIVVALDHTDAAAVTVFPDGETRFYDLERFDIPSNVEPDKNLMNERVFPVWVADQLFVYDLLETWSLNGPVLAGKLDLTRIGSFGHSFGGATALEVCRLDARCQAAANLDGGLYGAVMTEPAVRPILLMSSAESNQYSEKMDEWTRMVENATADAYWLELPGSTHFSFTITQLLSPILAPKGFDPRAGLHIIDIYLRAFFDIHLRGVEPRPEPVPGEMNVRWRTEARFYPSQK